MFYKNNCYIYSETRARTSYREDFRTLDTPESFRVSRASFDFAQIVLKSKCFGVHF